MKSICIQKDGQSWFFGYEDGNEEELLADMLEKAQDPETPFDIEDIVAVVNSIPEVFVHNS